MNKQKKLSKYDPYTLSIFTILSIIAALPGVLIAPYGINDFDEPYMMLNAFDWKNAVYSPVSSFLANFYGRWVEWRFVYFRYFAIILNSLSIFICGLYALGKVKNKNWIIVITVFCIFGCTFIKGSFNTYGWDCWTALFVSIATIVFIQFYERPSLSKILLLGALTSVIIGIRIPNITMVFLILLLTILLYFRRKERIYVIYACVYLIISCLLVWLVFDLLYGNIQEYVATIKSNTIREHSTYQVFKAFSGGVIKDLLLCIFLWVLYLSVKVIGSLQISDWKKYLIFTIIGCIVFYWLAVNSYLFTNVLYTLSSLFLLTVIYLLYQSLKYNNNKILFITLAVFGFCCIGAIGSNCGFNKILYWTFFPLIFMLLQESYNRPKKIFSVIFMTSIVVYSLYGLKTTTFFDKGLGDLTYKIKTGLAKGIYTTESKGKKIDNIVVEAEKYKKMGYSLMPLRSGNGYIWEYAFLQPNKYQRHMFNNWYAFWDKDYVDNIIEDAENSDHPVLIIYMQWDNDENQTYMLERLKNEFRRVLDGPGYSFWITP